MRNTTEQFWRDLQGKVVHVRIGHVFPHGENTVQVNAEILEEEQHISFEIETDE